MLSVTDIIGHNLLIASQDGRKVYEKIAAAFKEGRPVILSFKDGEDLTGAFLSDAIGHLYAKFPEVKVESSLSIVDFNPDDAEYLEDVIYWVKDSLKDPKGLKEAARQAFGED